MASIYKEIPIKAHPDNVWAAVRDFGSVHQRLAQGFITDTRLDGDIRVVTFATGMVIRERLIGIDDETRRLAYAAIGGKTIHHNASFQVFADGDGRSRLVWITDVLPNKLAGRISSLVERGSEAIKQTLERRESTG